MRPLTNFNFSQITTYTHALAEIECQIRNLKDLVDQCDDTFTEQDREQLVANIKWLKRFYETAERLLIDDN